MFVYLPDCMAALEPLSACTTSANSFSFLSWSDFLRNFDIRQDFPFGVAYFSALAVEVGVLICSPDNSFISVSCSFSESSMLGRLLAFILHTSGDNMLGLYDACFRKFEVVSHDKTRGLLCGDKVGDDIGGETKRRRELQYL